jgi:hypothetical protein
MDFAVGRQVTDPAVGPPAFDGEPDMAARAFGERRRPSVGMDERDDANLAGGRDRPEPGSFTLGAGEPEIATRTLGDPGQASGVLRRLGR